MKTPATHPSTGFRGVCYLLMLNSISGALSQCGGTLTLPVPKYDTVVITYPNNSAESYDKNLNCYWLLTTEPGLVFVFEVTLLVHCGDILRIHDGSSDSAPRLATLCTASTTEVTQPLYRTTSNEMLIYFNTDGTTNGNEKGFRFNVLSGNETSYKTEACNSNTKMLTATTEEEVLTSPLFPELYPSSTSCKWNISVSSELTTLRVALRFYDFKSTCNFSIIDDEQNERYFCAGSVFETTTLTSDSYFVISVQSDSVIQGRGFLLVYESVEVGTTTVPTTTADITTSPSASSEPTTIDLTTATSSKRFNQIPEMTIEALIVLVVFSVVVLAVGVTAPAVVYFSTRQGPAVVSPSQTWTHPALYQQYFPSPVYHKQIKF